jgi:uncharacterized protein (TIGR02246 family)
MSNPIETLEKVMQAWNSHDVEKIVSFYTPDCLYENEPSGVTAKGREGVRKFAEEGFKVNPDFKIESAQSFASGNKSAAECMMSGAHLGNGRKCCVISEYEGDLIKRSTFYMAK